MSGESPDRSGEPPDSEHERTIREVRDRFLKGLPDRLAGLRRALDEIGRSPPPDDRLGELWREAHNLAGTASSFGLSGLSEPARSVEGLAERWSEAGEVPEDGRAAARRHLAVLEERCRELLDRDEGGEPG